MTDTMTPREGADGGDAVEQFREDMKPFMQALREYFDAQNAVLLAMYFPNETDNDRP